MIKRQSDSEFIGHFKDVLFSQIKKTFKPKDYLVHVTFQPRKLTCLLPEQIAIKTKEIFKSQTYVAVYEETFNENRRAKFADFIGTWHSHIIMLESDFYKIEDGLKNLDIKAKLKYNIDGLIGYLSKQSHRNRIYSELCNPSIAIENKTEEVQILNVGKTKKERIQIHILYWIQMLLGNGKTSSEIKFIKWRMFQNQLKIMLRFFITIVLGLVYKMEQYILQKTTLPFKYLPYLPNSNFGTQTHSIMRLNPYHNFPPPLVLLHCHIAGK